MGCDTNLKGVEIYINCRVIIDPFETFDIEAPQSAIEEKEPKADNADD